MALFTPRRLVAIGLVVFAQSGGGLVIVELMGQAHNRETLNAHGVIVRQRAFGEITPEEAERRRDQLPTVGIAGYFLTKRGYTLYQTLALGGASPDSHSS